VREAVYIRRLVDSLLDDLAHSVPGVLLVGPRAAGKTTTAKRRANTVLSLGKSTDAAITRADPDAALVHAVSPVMIDEWQVVPDVLGAVRRQIDEGAQPGSYYVTGSTRADLSNLGWQATGRLVRIPLWGLTQRELHKRADNKSPLDFLFDGNLEAFARLDSTLTVRDYLHLSLISGFPEAASISSPRAYQLWLRSYVDQLLRRDAAMGVGAVDAVQLRRYLSAIAANTAGVVDHKTLYDAAGMNRQTATRHDETLLNLYLTDTVPAWTNSSFSRLTQTPKRYLCDPALAQPLLRIDERGAVRNPDLIGRLIDTFVAAQIRSEAVVAESAPTMFHLRQANGRHEIDLVLEGPEGRVVAIEIKAAAEVDPHDARHLAWFRDELGERFTVGVVFHTGRRSFPLGPKLWALPIASLWA
jgi:uncharacterized protein